MYEVVAIKIVMTSSGPVLLLIDNEGDKYTATIDTNTNQEALEKYNRRKQHDNSRN